MTTDELRVNLTYLVNTYVTDQLAKSRLLARVSLDDAPAKNILAELVPYLSNNVTHSDAKTIKDIAFYFC